MPKKVEDIVPSPRRSIREIPVPVRRSEAVRIESRESVGARLESEPSFKPELRRGSKNKRWIGTLLLILGIGLAFFALRNGATLSYNTKVVTLAFTNESYTAYQSAQSNELTYSLLKWSAERSQNVPASGEEEASVRAQGKVVIYNEQSIPQELIKTTRLATTDGKIYRIQENVIVPAKGSIEVTALADMPGPTYNIGLSDFTLPGLKGTARYENVFGRSKTAMTGGFIGKRKKVNESDLASAKEVLESSLRAELLARAEAERPKDFILFPDLTEIIFELLPTGSASGTEAVVIERGHLSAALFKRDELAQFLARQKMGKDSVPGKMDIADLATFKITTAGNSALSASSSMKISLIGTVLLRATVDEASLASDLAGINKSNIQPILSKYPAIESANAVVKPFWKKAFPSDPQKIKIKRQE